jgi:outer membrane protein OmpA-like peptidoglycan-associated protein
MKQKIVAIAIASVLVGAPALAESPAVPDRSYRAMGAAAVIGGALGAAFGGPPGAILGAALGSAATDWQQHAHRAGALEANRSALSAERDWLRADQSTLQAQIDELRNALAQERALGAATPDAAMLAEGLEYNVGFRTNSATPPDDIGEGLTALAQLVRAIPSLAIQLDGYADPRGSDKLNAELSMARARSIRERLIEAGVSPDRIRIEAHGASRTDRQQASDPDGWALQRRVSIRLERTTGRMVAKP